MVGPYNFAFTQPLSRNSQLLLRIEVTDPVLPLLAMAWYCSGEKCCAGWFTALLKIKRNSCMINCIKRFYY